MATLGLKEMGKFLWEGRENGGERNGHWVDILRYLFPLYSLIGPEAGAICFEIRISRKKNKELLWKIPSKMYGSYIIMEKKQKHFLFCQ